MTSFAQRAQREVERIKDMEVRDKERRQEKLAELAEASRRRREAAAIEEARLRGERDAKLIREQNDRVAAQERLEKPGHELHGWPRVGALKHSSKHGPRYGKRC